MLIIPDKLSKATYLALVQGLRNMVQNLLMLREEKSGQLFQIILKRIEQKNLLMPITKD